MRDVCCVDQRCRQLLECGCSFVASLGFTVGVDVDRVDHADHRQVLVDFAKICNTWMLDLKLPCSGTLV